MVEQRINLIHQWCCALLIFGLFFLLSSCGIKAPPRPPAYEPSPPVSQLSGVLENGQVVLSWYYDPSMGMAVQGFGIYQYKLSLSSKPCSGCPLTFEKIGDLPVDFPKKAGARAFHFVFSPESGFHYQFKVAAYAGGEIEGPASDPIQIDVP